MGVWTDERVAELKRLNNAGLSCSQIAGALAKDGIFFTRNAVIGKLHRIGAIKTTALRPESSARKFWRPPVKRDTSVQLPSALDKHGHRFTLLNIKHTGQCKFAYGDVGADDFHYCGNPATSTLDVWCSFHRAIVLTKSADQHRHHSPATIEKMRRAQRERRARAA